MLNRNINLKENSQLHTKPKQRTIYSSEQNTRVADKLESNPPKTNLRMTHIFIESSLNYTAFYTIFT